MEQFVFLMRHARHDDGALTDAGAKGVAAVAERFGEWRDAHEVAIDWYRTSAPEVRATASALFREVRRPNADKAVRFTTDRRTGGLPGSIVNEPAAFGAYDPDRGKIIELKKALENASSDGRAPLLVTNDPLVGWLAGQLADGDVAIAHGELVCLRRTRSQGPWHLLWTIDPADRAELVSILKKIESKMNSAKALGAVITALLLFVVKDVLREDPTWLDWCALVALVTSGFLYFAALFLYDGLLMPSRFWGPTLPDAPSEKKLSRAYRRIRRGRVGLARPPSSTQRVLQQAMVRVWNRIFVPATLALGVGLGCLVGSAAIRPEPTFEPNWWAAGAAGIVLLAVVAWASANRPILGVSD